ncbi:MAG: hypothetical protein ACKVTZ_06650 [Bacteroidia bacterium]
MNILKLIYRNGYFYDTQTNTRICIKEGAEIAIVADPAAFEAYTPIGTQKKVRLKEEQEDVIKQEKGVSHYDIVFERGTKLYFDIPVDKEEARLLTPTFEVELLEDLFVYLKHTWKFQEFRLWTCACVVTKMQNRSEADVPFEKVYGFSLNELYKNTYIHYFGNKGNPAVNAADRFYTEKRISLRSFFPDISEEPEESAG